jgi:hypothetical protein
MSSDQKLGLDELMIVNPGRLETQSIFLGEDGILYQVQDMAGVEDGCEAGQFFLGEDGQLYRTGDAESQTLGHYFLGEDGRLYERIS